MVVYLYSHPIEIKIYIFKLLITLWIEVEKPVNMQCKIDISAFFDVKLFFLLNINIFILIFVSFSPFPGK